MNITIVHGESVWQDGQPSSYRMLYDDGGRKFYYTEETLYQQYNEIFNDQLPITVVALINLIKNSNIQRKWTDGLLYVNNNLAITYRLHRINSGFEDCTNHCFRLLDMPLDIENSNISYVMG